MLDESVVPGPLLLYKNTLRLARGDDVRRCRAFYVRKLHEDAARTCSQACVVETARAARGGGVSRILAFLGRACAKMFLTKIDPETKLKPMDQ